jgi:hypothetical protein
MQPRRRRNPIRSQPRLRGAATVRALRMAWAWQDRTTLGLRTLWSAPAAPASGVVRRWWLHGLGRETLRQQGQGRWSEARLQTCLPR